MYKSLWDSQKLFSAAFVLKLIKTKKFFKQKKKKQKIFPDYKKIFFQIQMNLVDNIENNIQQKMRIIIHIYPTHHHE